MDGLTTVNTVFTSVKTAIDIAKLINESGVSLDKAEVKLQFAELIGSLADLKIQLSEVHEIVAEKDRIIAELEDSLKVKANIAKHLDAYYLINGNGKPDGDPFCLHCWEANGKLRSLSNISRQQTFCPACKTTYQSNSTYKISYNEEGAIQYNH